MTDDADSNTTAGLEKSATKEDSFTRPVLVAYLMAHVLQGPVIRLLVVTSFLIGHFVLTIGLAGPDAVLGTHVSGGIRVAGAGIVAFSLGIALHGLLTRRRCTARAESGF